MLDPSQVTQKPIKFDSGAKILATLLNTIMGRASKKAKK
jgi:hypothetical protein